MLFKTKSEVLQILGDPATISDYAAPAKADDKTLIYRFDSGYGGLQFSISFRNDIAHTVQIDEFE